MKQNVQIQFLISFPSLILLVFWKESCSQPIQKLCSNAGRVSSNTISTSNASILLIIGKLGGKTQWVSKGGADPSRPEQPGVVQSCLGNGAWIWQKCQVPARTPHLPQEALCPPSPNPKLHPPCPKVSPTCLFPNLSPVLAEISQCNLPDSGACGREGKLAELPVSVSPPHWVSQACFMACLIPCK